MSSSRPPRPPPRSNAPLVLGLVAFTAFMGAVPVLLQKRVKRLQDGVPMIHSEQPLSATQVRRGAYLNTGSVDVGPDPDWDHKTFTYKGRKPAIVDEGRAK